MGEKSRLGTSASAVGGALAVALALIVGIAAPARADDAPSWAQVQAAKSNAAAAQAELKVIQSATVQLQSELDAAGAAELKAAYAATEAQNALDAAEANLTALSTQLATAKTQAAAATARFVGTEVQLDRLGGGNDLTAQLLATSGGSSDLLGKLSSLNQLGRRSSDLETTARQKQNLVTSLRAQASSAEKARTALKADADSKLQAAQAAQTAAQAKLAAGQQQLATLTQQAAALGGQAQALQQQYDAEAAARQAAAEKSGSSGGGVETIDTSGVVVDVAAAKAYAQQAIARYGWGDDQFDCLVSLWNMESGWRANAYNVSSGAYGIPQALPGSKMASAGADWRTNANTQIDWGLSYISGRYGSPCAAWAFETSHVPYWY